MLVKHVISFLNRSNTFTKQYNKYLWVFDVVCEQEHYTENVIYPNLAAGIYRYMQRN